MLSLHWGVTIAEYSAFKEDFVSGWHSSLKLANVRGTGHLDWQTNGRTICDLKTVGLKSIKSTALFDRKF